MFNNANTENKINEISIFQPDWFKKIYFLGLAETFEQNMNFPEKLKTNHLIFLKSHNEIYTFVFTTGYENLVFDKIADSQDVSFFKLDSLKDFELLLNNEKIINFYIPNKVKKIEKQYEYGQTILGPCRMITSPKELKKGIYSSYFTLITEDMKDCNMEEFKDFIKNNFSLEKIINLDDKSDVISIETSKEEERD